MSSWTPKTRGLTQPICLEMLSVLEERKEIGLKAKENTD
jgi:hypothetical protein